MAKAFQYGMYAISGVAFTSALVAALPVVGAAGTIAGMVVSVPSLCAVGSSAAAAAAGKSRAFQPADIGKWFRDRMSR